MRIILLLTIALMVGCQSSNVVVDYDTQTQFSNYRYYDFKEGNIEGADRNTDPASKTVQDKLITERVQKAVSVQLRRNGFTPASDSQPADVLIQQSVVSQVRTEASGSNARIGLGSSGRNVGLGFSFRFPLGKDTVKKDVTIFIDMLDAKSEQLKWRGTKTLVFSDQTPAEINELVEAAVAEIFGFYPPGAE